MGPKRNSTRIARLAAILWLASLGLPALISFEPIETIWGISILLTGWLGVLYTGNLAWFANVFFIWGCFYLRRGRPALTLAWFAILLSLTTFWLVEFPADEGGGKAWVFGYGWGAVAWFSALFLLGVAAAVRNLEPRDEQCHGDQNPRGIVLGARISAVAFSLMLVGFVGGTLLVSKAQRAAVADAERAFFRNAIVKRGAVCATPDVKIQDRVHLDGPLEVTYNVHNQGWAGIPDLLRWGIPAVTVKDITYSLRQPPDWSTVIFAPRLVQSHARMSVASITREMPVDFLLIAPLQTVPVKTLRLESGGRTLIDAEWRRPMGQSYCPTFRDHSSNHPPAKLLREALLDDDRQVGSKSFTLIRREVVSRFTSETVAATANCPEPSARINIYSQDFRELPGHIRQLLTAAVQSPGMYGLPNEYLISGDVYFGLKPYEPHVITSLVCDGSTMYIVTVQPGFESRDSVDIDMRDRSNPHESRWTGNFELERPSGLEAGVVNVYARSVRRDDNGWQLELDYRRPLQSGVVQVAVTLAKTD